MLIVFFCFVFASFVFEIIVAFFYSLIFVFIFTEYIFFRFNFSFFRILGFIRLYRSIPSKPPCAPGGGFDGPGRTRTVASRAGTALTGAVRTGLTRRSPTVRQQRGKEQMSKMASQVTGNLLSINRQLAEQVDRSKQTLDVLGKAPWFSFAETCTTDVELLDAVRSTGLGEWGVHLVARHIWCATKEIGRS